MYTASCSLSLTGRWNLRSCEMLRANSFRFVGGGGKSNFFSLLVKSQNASDKYPATTKTSARSVDRATLATGNNFAVTSSTRGEWNRATFFCTRLSSERSQTRSLPNFPTDISAKAPKLDINQQIFLIGNRFHLTLRIPNSRNLIVNNRLWLVLPSSDASENAEKPGCCCLHNMMQSVWK